MTTKMYCVGDVDLSNEELAIQVRYGNDDAAAPEGATDDELIREISERKNVSKKATRSLLLDHRAIFGAVPLNEPAVTIRRYGDASKVYGDFMRRKLLLQSMTEVFTPRELNVVKYHLGLDRPGGQEMTFAELAVCLNYSGPSAAEKTFKRTVKKLRERLYAGKYGTWVAANQAIQEAKREAQKYQGYVSPQIVWWERSN